jgi:hypothetical protein
MIVAGRSRCEDLTGLVPAARVVYLDKHVGIVVLETC